MGYLLGVILFALGIALTIALHEAGHMGVARLLGMRVRRYFIGFGPTVGQFTRGHTTYGLKAVPLGGFCDIAGMTANDPLTPEEEPLAMWRRPAWQRIAVLAGGVVMNIFVGLVLIYTVAVSAGIPDPDIDLTPTVDGTACVAPAQNPDGSLVPCSGEGPAAEAGITAGDRITAVDGRPMHTFIELRDTVMAKPGETVELTVERDGITREVAVTVAEATRIDAVGGEVTVGAIGVSRAPVGNVFRSYGPVEGIGASLRFAGLMFSGTVEGLKSFPAKIPGVAAAVFGGERAQDSPVSVVGATRIGGELAERSEWATFLMMLASLNFFLALFNVVPLPPLDGGHIAVVLWEKLRDAVRRLRGLPSAGPADYRGLMPLTYTVAALLLTVGVVVIAADVVNPIRLPG
ncbi:site-2 protease family protein [Corynebacterium sp. CCM 9186]|uniref:M50 family metallopeptidase n=1 Tax=Corynebacterium meridianum TaxID=2765363 RepID=UPI00200540FE|nr:site-2 protease family protein [Corynebacterium meridianum]